MKPAGRISRSLFSAPVTPPVGYASLRGSLRGKQRSIPPKVHPVILRVKTSHLFAGENQPPLRRFFHNIILSFCKRVETDFYCSWIVFGLDCRYLNGG